MTIDISANNTQQFSGYRSAADGGSVPRDFVFNKSQVSNTRRVILASQEYSGADYDFGFVIPASVTTLGAGKLRVQLTDLYFSGSNSIKFGCMVHNNSNNNLLNNGLNVSTSVLPNGTPTLLSFESPLIGSAATGGRRVTPYFRSSAAYSLTTSQEVEFGYMTVTWEYSNSANGDDIVLIDNAPICFSGNSQVKILDGDKKKIKDLKRGDLILTNDGYQPLAQLDVGFNPSDDLMVKIPKDFLAENVPSEDVYVTKTHPLSVKVRSAKNDKDFEFLHLFVKELMHLGDGIEYVKKDEEKNLYNLIFDNHYEISVGNMKFLSHHPNHNNGNKRLKEGQEINPSYRTKKVYADDEGIYFKIINLKKLLKRKPENMTDKEYVASVLRFD